MKGIVFTEFFSMIEEAHGYEMVDKLIEKSSLASGGIYTAVGTYDHNEMVTLVIKLSEELKTPVSDLLLIFGKHLFNTLSSTYSDFFTEHSNAFDFLESVENHIHVEVRKLYPEAQLPTFDTKRIGNDQLEMIYRSERKMSDIALGLIEKSMVYYSSPCDIEKRLIEEDGSIVQFLITLK